MSTDAKKQTKMKKKFYDVVDSDFISMIEDSVKVAIPKFGIHRPMIWKRKDKIGIIYKVIANICKSEIKSLKTSSNKHDVMKFKWKFTRGRIKPEVGYEDFISNMPNECIKKLQSV